MTTTAVGLLKRERGGEVEDGNSDGILGMYRTLSKVICLPAITSYAVISLTSKVRFPFTDLCLCCL